MARERRREWLDCGIMGSHIYSSEHMSAGVSSDSAGWDASENERITTPWRKDIAGTHQRENGNDKTVEKSWCWGASEKTGIVETRIKEWLHSWDMCHPFPNLNCNHVSDLDGDPPEYLLTLFSRRCSIHRTRKNRKNVTGSTKWRDICSIRLPTGFPR